MSKTHTLPAPMYPVDDMGKLGPAMRALPTDRMRAFVTFLVTTGQNNHAAAARAAGYQGNEDTIKVTGHRLAHDERVINALHEEGKRRMQSAAVLAAGVLVNLANDPTDKKVQLRAAEALLNRVGLHATTEHIVSRGEDSGGMIENIKRLAAELGLDAVKLLGAYGVSEKKKAEAIDTEATEVVEHDTTGLEDVL